MSYHRKYSLIITHHLSLTRTGYTMVEVMIAGIISAVMVAVALALFTHSLRMEKSDRSQLLMVDNVRRGLVRMRQEIMAANTITVKDSGNRLEIEELSGTIKAFFYQDDDNDPLTINNNYIVFDPNILIENNEIGLIKYVSASAGQSIFTDPSSESSSVEIRFHVGDTPQNMANANAYTGPGYQGLDVVTIITPRNTHLE